MRKLFPYLIYFFIRLLGATLRVRVEDRCGVVSGALPPGVIIVMWHNRILLAPFIFRRFVPKRAVVVLTSPSKDGEILAQVIRAFDAGVVRGSSSRRGAVAMRQMVAHLEAGTDITITPDGPRGPVYRFGPGAIKLAEITGRPLVPYRICYRSYWELRTWDRFQIPKPFSRVDIVFGPPCEVAVPAGAGAESDAEQARAENTLREALA